VPDQSDRSDSPGAGLIVCVSPALTKIASLRTSGDATESPLVVGEPLPGTHTVSVVAIDRAGNRSVPLSGMFASSRSQTEVADRRRISCD
jgi:hypothetical protein